MCNINDPRILNAYIAITEDEPTDWYADDDCNALCSVCVYILIKVVG